nr:MAG TPA_asm: hypothetical protein [Caudoviricetes sp.]
MYSSKSAQCDLCLTYNTCLSLKKNSLRHVALYYYRKCL